jgi:hypothetical protein
MVVSLEGGSFWTIKPGNHSFQVRLPHQPGASRIIHVAVE